MSAPKAPAPPDPVATAEASAKYNRQAAIDTQSMNMVDQYTPYGTLAYNKIGEENGVPRYSATTTLSPEQQALYNLQTSGQQKFGNIANTQLDNISGRLSEPWSMDTAGAQKLAEMQRTFLDPQWARNEEQLRTRLANQGISDPGSEAYKNSFQNFEDARSRAYNQMYLDAYGMARDTSLQERNQPINELGALMSGSQVTQPTWAQTPQSQVQPVDYANIVNTGYMGALKANEIEAANRNAMIGGLSNIGAAFALPMGGWTNKKWF